QLLGDDVHHLVGGLRAQHRGHQQLERRRVVERGARVRVLLLQPTQDEARALLLRVESLLIDPGRARLGLGLPHYDAAASAAVMRSRHADASPRYNSQNFARRYNRCIPSPHVHPMPPCTWIASLATLRAASAAA